MHKREKTNEEKHKQNVTKNKNKTKDITNCDPTDQENETEDDKQKQTTIKKTSRVLYCFHQFNCVIDYHQKA